MSAAQPRQPKGRPTGGEYAATEHAEAGVTLTAPARTRPELEQYGPIPAPAEGQTYTDGTPVTAKTFEDAYAEFFRPLEEHEAAHGPYQSQPRPSEGELQALAGLTGVDLGRERGTWLEKDEEGEAVIVVHTRNGGGNRDCWNEDEDGNGCGTCTGCIQTDVIPSLPTYIRDEDDEGDCTYANNYFRPVDPEAGRALLAAEEQRQRLYSASFLRDAIVAGDQPPWAVLAPRRGDCLPAALSHALRASADALARSDARTQDADIVDEAVKAGTKIDTRVSTRIPLREMIAYNSAVGRREKATVELAAARKSLTGLRDEYSAALPPKIRALANDELDRLGQAVDKASEQLVKATADEKAGVTALARLAQDWRAGASRDHAEHEKVHARVKAFWWSNAWPGDDIEECPPRP